MSFKLIQDGWQLRKVNPTYIGYKKDGSRIKTLTVSVPSNLLRELNLQPNNLIGFKIIKNRIVIAPVKIEVKSEKEHSTDLH